MINQPNLSGVPGQSHPGCALRNFRHLTTVATVT